MTRGRSSVGENTFRKYRTGWMHDYRLSQNNLRLLIERLGATWAPNGAGGTRAVKLIRVGGVKESGCVRVWVKSSKKKKSGEHPGI
jgi:hypothetical protein